eukprot:19971-Amphidinium_carterae.1
MAHMKLLCTTIPPCKKHRSFHNAMQYKSSYRVRGGSVAIGGTHPVGLKLEHTCWLRCTRSSQSSPS